MHLEDSHEMDTYNLKGIELNLMNEEGQLLQTTFTDADGEFTFNDIMPGALTIRPTTHH